MALTNQQLEDRVLLIEDLLNKVVRIVNNSLVTREEFNQNSLLKDATLSAIQTSLTSLQSAVTVLQDTVNNP